MICKLRLCSHFFHRLIAPTSWTSSWVISPWPDNLPLIMNRHVTSLSTFRQRPFAIWHTTPVQRFTVLVSCYGRCGTARRRSPKWGARAWKCFWPVEEGYRPQLQQLNTQVAFKLSQLVEECWSKDATKRRTLEYCTSVIRDILSS